MNARFEERVTELPDVPKAFGEDGGHFYRYYDALADEIDDDMVKSLKAQLDGILIYAGLFAGVNSAFLALTLPEMSADPADDTNALLFHLVTGSNRNITLVEDLPSASFSPASGMVSINILFSLSLTLALLAAFLAVLGQQWLVYYRKRSGGGADAQRWEQLRRYLGAKHWRLEAILDDILPSLLQLGLVIFCAGFALYLKTLSPWVCYLVTIPMGLALACIIFMAISATVDLWCPFKSPLSRALKLLPPSVGRPAWHIILSCLSVALTGFEKAKTIIGRAAGSMAQWARAAAAYLRPWASGVRSRTTNLAGILTKFVMHQGLEEAHVSHGSALLFRKSGLKYPSKFVSSLAENIPRPAEPVHRLNAIAAKRILCTSEDPNALIYTGMNLCALASPELSEWLLSDEEVYNRLWEAVKRCRIKEDRYNSTSSALHALPSRALHSAFIDLVFASGKAYFLLSPRRDPQSFPPTLTDSTKLERIVEDLRNRVDVIGGSLRDRSVAEHPSMTQLGLLLIDMMLNPSRLVNVRPYDQWFNHHAFLSEALARKPGSFVPFLASLLTYAIQSFYKLKLRSSSKFVATPSQSAWLKDLETSKKYLEWSLDTACNIIRMYHERDVQNSLELLREALSTHHLDPYDRPSNRVYISLLQHYGMYQPENEFDDRQWKRFCVATAIDLLNSVLRSAQRLTLSQQEPDQLRDDLEHCLKFLDQFLHGNLDYIIADHQDNEIPSKYAEFLKLASEALQRRLDTLGKAQWGIVIHLGNSIVGSKGLRIIRYGAMTEECQKAYQEIESALGDEGFLKTMSCLEFSLDDNPADPPSIEAMQGNAGTTDTGGDTATPECNAEIFSQKEGTQSH